ncbi:alpha/beta hydrolase family protein [Stenotrophomonas indicatrix]|uniref:Dipeptidyl aminopeptidase/acylaminoacyl peptidase n=1 Tax=Stenotrophomonas indicatrix TaxID=2045451 RepID=A0A1W1GYC9_9GAMM|nr:S9 family peptidase [Stenotrophomonas indicatrix]QBR43607.1 prolyl oligopeptidase family protein [Stenotrophomonas indicatrix]TPD70942.1 S9 family peptidase [Stenotrophomonas maltophilia]SLM24298.1 Dipeptidyl aminopeptidase/acylaminoacyl peptidase [Stenotrophomonas indicatrix]
MRRIVLAALLCAVVGGTSAGTGGVDLDRYLRQEAFADIKISPGGEYVAATVPIEAGTALAIYRIADMKMVGTFRPPRNNHAHTFDWVSNERLLVGMAQKLGVLDRPAPTGELFGINANGKGGELLVGYRTAETGLGTNIKVKPAGMVAAFLTDELKDDDRNVLVAVTPFTDNAATQIERMDVSTGRRNAVARAPIAQAAFTTDARGEVRFAYGVGPDQKKKLYYRAGASSEWILLHDEALNPRNEAAIGFSADGRLAYLQVEQAEGPDVIVSWDPQSNERRTVLRDEIADPARIIHRPGTQVPVGALFMGTTPRTRFFDETSEDARLYRSLETALGAPVYITSSTRNGSTVLVESWSGRNPGDFYLYDTLGKRARHLISRSDWIDPAQSADVRAITLQARDGRPLHGFLTVPPGVPMRALPMVVVPHGGPIGVLDDGTYSTETQMLAAAGYAVLQVNFRGSAGYGRAHAQAARKQWGAAMQDDVTDATRWAIEQGIADRERICIYGASYGAYAALMGTVREPGLYRCAAGYVGIYDLPLMYARGDIQSDESGLIYLREWLGRPKDLVERSPVNLAAQVGVPVLLAAGREDQRAPVVHTERMEAALKQAGTPVQALYYKNEGHGLYNLANQRDYYGHLLAFLSRSLGGATAQVTAAGNAEKAP